MKAAAAAAALVIVLSVRQCMLAAGGNESARSYLCVHNFGVAALCSCLSLGVYIHGITLHITSQIQVCSTIYGSTISATGF
jgi:uncharacterized membrane protein